MKSNSGSMQVVLDGLDEKLRFKKLIGALPRVAFGLVRDVVDLPFSNESFMKVKSRLISNFAMSPAQCRNQIRALKYSGKSVRPLFNNMKGLGKKSLSYDAIIEKFLKKLPDSLKVGIISDASRVKFKF